jgi:MoxR-like ATPase
MTAALPDSIDATERLLADHDYVAGRALATSVFLALRLQRPLFLEGEPGTGKTEIAKVLAAALGAELIRLQCYEGLDIGAAAYEWNHARQIIEIRLAEAAHASREQLAADLFSERFLIERPLLRALQPHPVPPVLLIDELDRADEPFEAYLLEVLSDFQITIPEWKTVKAAVPPVVILTSNRTREIHDAVKRRCIYHWVDYPDAAREFEIVRRKLPQARAELSRQIVAFVQSLRREDLEKKPGVAEMLDFAAALAGLGVNDLTDDPLRLQATLATLLKTQGDRGQVPVEVAQRLAGKAA